MDNYFRSIIILTNKIKITISEVHILIQTTHLNRENNISQKINFLSYFDFPPTILLLEGRLICSKNKEKA